MAFRVPEANRLREGPLASDPAIGNYGSFLLPSPAPGWALITIESEGAHPEDLGDPAGWKHVSVRAIRGKQSRTPNWREMCAAKDAFWDSEDAVMQLHPRRSQYVNHHPHVLHLWRPRDQA